MSGVRERIIDARYFVVGRTAAVRLSAAVVEAVVADDKKVGGKPGPSAAGNWAALLMFAAPVDRVDGYFVLLHCFVNAAQSADLRELRLVGGVVVYNDNVQNIEEEHPGIDVGKGVAGLAGVYWRVKILCL